MRTIEAEARGRGVRVAVVVSRFNPEVAQRLLTGCLERLRELECEDVDVIWVPGALEIPLATQTAVESGRYDAGVTLGVVIRGETSHYDYVCRGVSDGLRDLGLRSGFPLGFGVLTTEDSAQALARAALPGESGSNKGAEAAEVALEMVGLLAALRKDV